MVKRYGSHPRATGQTSATSQKGFATGSQALPDKLTVRETLQLYARIRPSAQLVVFFCGPTKVGWKSEGCSLH